MPEPKNILVADCNTDNGALLVRTLRRKFPAAAVQLCGDSAAVAAALQTGKVEVAVLHRTFEDNAITLTTTVRALAPDVVIVVVSGLDRSRDVLAAGADAFLHYEAWLRLGTVVGEAWQSGRHAMRKRGADPSAEPEAAPAS